MRWFSLVKQNGFGVELYRAAFIYYTCKLSTGQAFKNIGFMQAGVHPSSYQFSSAL